MSTRPKLRAFGAPSPPTKSEPLKAARETFWSAPGQDLPQNCLRRGGGNPGTEKCPGFRRKSDPFK